MKEDKQFFCVTISTREKDGVQPIISYIVYFINVDMSFTWNTDVFVSVSAKLKCKILFQGISDATKVDIYCAVTIRNLERKSSLIQLHISFNNED